MLHRRSPCGYRFVVLLATVSFFGLVAGILPVHAQDDFESSFDELKTYAEGKKLLTKEPAIVITDVAMLILGLLAAIAVVGVVWGAILYILAMGDRDKVATAKQAILFSLIGLIIAALAFAIVNYVVYWIAGPGAPAPGGEPP